MTMGFILAIVGVAEATRLAAQMPNDEHSRSCALSAAWRYYVDNGAISL